MKSKFDIKKYYKENKRKSIIFMIAGIIIILFIFILLTEPKKEEDGFNVDTSISENNSKQSEKIAYIPPKKEANKTTPPPVPNVFILDDKKDLNLTKKGDSNEDKVEIADISEQSFEALKQEEAIKKIEKSQKPKDMVKFLKKIQPEISLIDSRFFKYDFKNFYIGELFLDWFEIEDINKNFIRFKDRELNYSYNLRFLEN